MKHNPKIAIWKCDLPEMRLIPHEGMSEKIPVWEVAEEVEFSVTFEVMNLRFIKEPDYRDSTLTITIPKGFLTDLGSVPKFSLIQPVRFPRPAVLHDFAYRNTITRDNSEIVPNPNVKKDHSLDWVFDPSNGNENQKKFFDAVLYEQCRRHCKSLSRSAPLRIYWAVRMFGGSSFHDIDTNVRMARIRNKIYPN